MSYNINYTEEIDANNAFYYVSLDKEDASSQQFIVTAPKTASQTEIDALVDVLIAQQKEISDSIAEEEAAKIYAAEHGDG